MRTNLIVVRAGDKSLHPQWIDPCRQFDVAVSYYGDFPDRYRDQHDHFHHFKGSKWEGLNDFLERHASLLRGYRHVWMPDDDLFSNAQNINRFFSLCEALDFTIAQPALTPYSHYSWPITLQRRGCIARLTDFVEVMAPCFKVEDLPLFAKSFRENTSGWGYEWLWAHIAKQHDVFRLGIIDETPVFHTRAVGTAGHGGSRNSPSDEMNALLARHGLQKTTPKVIKPITNRWWKPLLKIAAT